MSLVTRCPKCDSGFTVTADLLRLHDGLVRCGQCSHVFDGFSCLEDSLPTLTQRVGEQTAAPVDAPERPTAPAPKAEPVLPVKPEPEPEPVPEPTVPQVFRMVAQRHGATASVPSEPKEPSIAALSPTSSVTTASRAEPVLTRASDSATVLPTQGRAEPAVKIVGEARLRGDDPSAFGRTVPEFMEDEEPESPSSALIWLTASIALLLLLIGQLLYVYRDDLASSAPTLRPLLEQACRPLGCEVGYVRRIERVFVVGSSLQLASNQASAPTGRHEYMLRLTLQNRYDRAQPWPSLMVSLTDASGTVVIRKAVTPSQYLPPTLLSQPFGAQQEASLEIPLTVMGAPISGFEIDKFFP